MSLTLSPAELQDLTGYKRPAGQREWLIERRWLFEVDGKGRPKVSRSYAESKLGGQPEPSKRQWQPDFSDLAEAG